MEQTLREKIGAVRLTEEGKHCFFGYYDVPAFSGDGEWQLYHEVDFMDRLPTGHDRARIGMVHLRSGERRLLTDTAAWNFQQGSMLQWNPAAPNEEILFNGRENGRDVGIIHHVHTGERRTLERPVACVDRNGRLALSVNFYRMFDFRPGYGYAGIEDAFREEHAPKEDGIFAIDLASGKSKLVLSLHELWEATKEELPGSRRQKLLINHITLNPEGTRYVALLRYFPEAGETWGTALITGNADGSGLYRFGGYSYASHYCWRDAEHLLIHANGTDGQQLYLLRDRTQEQTAIDRRFFLKDGHCSYSPDLEWILYDSYPDERHYRHLYLYHVKQKRGATLASYYHDPAIIRISRDIRCDLHPRWNREGTGISFDSIHEGYRAVYYMDLHEVMRSMAGG